MAIKYTNDKSLSNTVQKVGRAKGPLSKGSRKAVMATRAVKVYKTYDGPLTDCITVAGYVENCSTLQNVLINRLDNTPLSNDVASQGGRITDIENAGYITCDTLAGCRDFSALVVSEATKITCADLLNQPCRENIEDIVGGMIGYQVGIEVTYDDGTGKLNFVVQPGCGDFCNFVMSCQGILDMQSTLTDHEIRISALESGGGGGGLDCTTVMSCAGISAIRTQLDNAYTGSSWNAATNTITFTEVDGGTETLVLTGVTAAQVSKILTNTLLDTFVHNLGKYPTVLCLDNSGNVVIPASLNYPSNTIVVATFNQNFSGTIYAS